MWPHSVGKDEVTQATFNGWHSDCFDILRSAQSQVCLWPLVEVEPRAPSQKAKAPKRGPVSPISHGPCTMPSTATLLVSLCFSYAQSVFVCATEREFSTACHALQLMTPWACVIVTADSAQPGAFFARARALCVPRGTSHLD